MTSNKYSRVSARSHKTKQDNAKCVECKVTYNNWNYLTAPSE